MRPASRARASSPPFSADAQAELFWRQAEARAHLEDGQPELAQTARRRGACGAVSTASRTPTRCGCGRRGFSRRSPSSLSPWLSPTRWRASHLRSRRRDWGNGSADNIRASGPLILRKNKAEDMTAPTTSATPKIALDQRATSRHDNAVSGGSGEAQPLEEALALSEVDTVVGSQLRRGTWRW